MPILTTIINEAGRVKGSEWPSCYVEAAKRATKARRIAANIAKLPELLRKPA
jgi:hypothetical protein